MFNVEQAMLFVIAPQGMKKGGWERKGMKDKILLSIKI